MKGRVKKSVSLIAILLLSILMCAGLSGCHYILHPSFNYEKGVNLFYFSDEKYHYVEAIIMMEGAQTAGFYDNYIFNIIKNEFPSVTRESVEATEEDSGYSFLYYVIKSERQKDIKPGEPFVNATESRKPGFLFGKYTVNAVNPLKGFNLSTTKLNNIYNALKYGSGNDDGLYEKYDKDIDDVNFKVVLPANARVKSKNGKLSVENFDYLVEWNYKLGENKPLEDLEYSFSYFISFYWFIFALIIGVTVTLLVIKLAKKDGSIRTKPVGQSQWGHNPNANQFDPFNFNGNSGNPGNTGGGNNGNNGSNGNVFPGY